MKLLAMLFVISITFSCLSFAQEPCDYKVEILVNKTDFQKQEFNWRMKATKIDGKSTNMTGTAEISDSKGNIVKKYNPWDADPISRQKTSSEYSPNLKEGEEYTLKAEINVQCDDTNKTNNVDNKLIKIIRLKTEEPLASKKLDTKNNSDYTKTSTSDGINNSAPAAINPQQIQANEEKTEQKQANTTQEIQIKEETDSESADNVISLKGGNLPGQTTQDAAQDSGIVFESSNEKSRNLVLYLILAISLVLNIILIWKR